VVFLFIPLKHETLRRKGEEFGSCSERCDVDCRRKAKIYSFEVSQVVPSVKNYVRGKVRLCELKEVKRYEFDCVEEVYLEGKALKCWC